MATITATRTGDIRFVKEAASSSVFKGILSGLIISIPSLLFGICLSGVAVEQSSGALRFIAQLLALCLSLLSIPLVIQFARRDMVVTLSIYCTILFAVLGAAAGLH